MTTLATPLQGILVSSASRLKKDKKVLRTTAEPTDRTFGDNSYHGVLREDNLGSVFLDSQTATYSWANGLKYEGPFTRSQIDGKGKYMWPDGSTYEGELQNGKRHGEGIFRQPDGNSYEGQWKLGKREGRGKLIFSKDGTAYYDGEWRDGQKHGKGKQVWATGNYYEGNWEAGKMSGAGMMVWKMATGFEQYSGQWEDNNPHGEGTHIWLAFDPASENPNILNLCLQAQPQQQLRNRYTGTWLKGKREGDGTFYYANGASYTGQWKNHLKHGQGRYTFDDGRVYEGAFEFDRMTDYPGDPPVHQLDNPVTRCIDLSDLSSLALPHDLAKLPCTDGAGYHEHSKILRGLYNTVLRYLGELKELYLKYRTAAPTIGEDPFVLNCMEFWIYCRDAGILTPSCTIARVNRSLCSGPRFLRETAPADVEHLRPLTPRTRTLKLALPIPAKIEEPKPQAQEEMEDKSPELPVLPPTEVQSIKVTNLASSEITKSRRASRAAGVLETLTDSSPVATLPTPELEVPPSREGEDVSKNKVDVSVLGSRFVREGDGKTWGFGTICNIHYPERPLLMRHFYDGMVRLALTRCPNERGLETQTLHFFKELVLPSTANSIVLPHFFSFYTLPENQEILKEFESQLWQQFQAEAEAFANGRVGVNRGLGNVLRCFHVGARLDVTLRVKDVLRYLEQFQLLKLTPPELPNETVGIRLLPDLPPQAAPPISVQPAGSPSPAPAPASSRTSLKKKMSRADEEESPRVAGTPPQDDPEGSAQEDLPEESGSAASSARECRDDDPFGQLLLRSMPPGFGDFASEEKKEKKQKRTSTMLESLETKSLNKVGKPGRQRAHTVIAPVLFPPLADDYKLAELALEPFEVLRVLGEVFPRSSQEMLCWELPAPVIPTSEDEEENNQEQTLQLDDQRVSLLEYMETEITFLEFLRALFQLADIMTSKLPPLTKQTNKLRIDGFFRFVLCPSSQQPVEAAGGTSPLGVTTQGHVSFEPGTHRRAEARPPEATPAPATEKPPEEPQTDVQQSALWRGWDDAPPAEALAAPRMWPDGYMDEFEEWENYSEPSKTPVAEPAEAAAEQ